MENGPQPDEEYEITTSEVIGVLPLSHYGMDPLCQTCLKMYITDVLNMPEVDSGIFRYRDRFVTTVDILGTVTKVYIGEKVIIYAVDDSTGVIAVSSWRIPSDDPQIEARNRLSAALVGSDLHSKLMEIRASQQIFDGCKLGTVLHVRGTVSTFGGMREIQSFQCTAIRDPRAEMERMLELPSFYEKFYDCPIILPTRLAFDLNHLVTPVDGVSDEAQTHRRLVGAILLHVNLHKLESVAVEQLAMDSSLTSITASSEDPDIWFHALGELAAKGFLYEHQANPGEYWVVKYDKILRQSVLKIMRRSSSEEKDGSDFASILAELRNLVAHCKISKPALEQCLNCLERQSDIACTSHRQYVAVSYS